MFVLLCIIRDLGQMDALFVGIYSFSFRFSHAVLLVSFIFLSFSFILVTITSFYFCFSLIGITELQADACLNVRLDVCAV